VRPDPTTKNKGVEEGLAVKSLAAGEVEVEDFSPMGERETNERWAEERRFL